MIGKSSRAQFKSQLPNSIREQFVAKQTIYRGKNGAPEWSFELRNRQHETFYSTHHFIPLIFIVPLILMIYFPSSFFFARWQSLIVKMNELGCKLDFNDKEFWHGDDWLVFMSYAPFVFETVLNSGLLRRLLIFLCSMAILIRDSSIVFLNNIGKLHIWTRRRCDDRYAT